MGATSNLDEVKSTDRQALGPQPDNTPVGPGSTTGGGGGATPTGPAGGDLGGTYPNPTLAPIVSATTVGDATHVSRVTIDAKGRVTALSAVAITGVPPGGSAGGDLTGTFPNPTLVAIGAATGPVGDSTHVAQVTIDAKGRVTALSSVAIVAGGTDYIFNVKTYGALGDGSTDDTAAIQLAANALTAAGRGTLFFPDGRYIISSDIVIGSGISYTGTPPAPYNANFAIAGTSRMGAVIIQTGASATGIYVNLTGGSNYAWNRAECFNLGLRVGNGVTAGYAIEYDYGASPVVSSEQPSGSVVHSVDIGRDSPTFSGGWTSGILFNNPWKGVIYDVNAFGCDAGNVVPTSGAGSGAVIELVGGVNFFVDKIYASFWQRGILLDGIGGNASQGVLLTNVILVAVMEGFRLIAGANVSNLQLVNWLVDQGNSPNNGLANVAFYLDGDVSGTRGNCSLVNCSWIQVAGSGLSCGIYFNNMTNCCVTAPNAFNNGVAGAVVLDGVSQYNIFSGGRYGGGTITLGASTVSNEFNCIGLSTFADSGTGNVGTPTLV